MIHIETLRSGTYLTKDYRRIFVHTDSCRRTQTHFRFLLAGREARVIQFPSTMHHDAFASLFTAILRGQAENARSLDYADEFHRKAQSISEGSVLA